MNLRVSIISRCPPALAPFAARLQSDSLGARLARGTFWTLSGNLVARGFALLGSILIARLLGKETFGALGIIQSTTSLFGLFAGFGMGLTATKHVAEFRRTEPKRVAGILSDTALFSWISGGLMAGCLYAFSPWLARHTLAAPGLGPLLRASTPLLFLTGLQGAQLGALSGFEAFRTIARLNVLTGLITFPLLMGGTLVWGIDGTVWGLVVAQLVICILNERSLRQTAETAGVPVRFSSRIGDLGLIWDFSLPAVLNGALVIPVNWVCNAILVNQSSGYAEMGLLNAVSQWRNAVLLLPSIVSSVSLPLLSALQSAESERASQLVWKSMKLNAGVAFIGVLAISALSPLIMGSYGMYSPRSVVALIILCLSALISGTVGVMGQYIVSRGLMWWGMLLNLIWALVLVSAVWSLRSWGALGIALANLIAYGVHLCTVALFTVRFLPESKPA